VLLLGMGITLAAFVVLSVVAWNLVGLLALLDIAWLDELIAYGAFLVFLVVMVLLFPAVATMVISLFLDDIVEAVDARHYPNEAPGTPLGFAQSLTVSARFSGIVILANLVALPFYLLLIFFPPINLFIFYGLNGYLLSREYFELVTLRHLDAASAGRLRKANRGKLLAVGVVITFMLTIPIINIVAPIIATASMNHIFKGLRAPMA
jgi:uncharacterized protein involved in cysteine biosynthesis